MAALTGTGNNTVRLSLAEVMENGGKNLFVDDGRVQMKVLGNSGDVVDLSDLLNNDHLGNWSPQGQVTVDGVGFDVYRHSGLAAEVLVQQGVTVKLGVGTSLNLNLSDLLSGGIDQGDWVKKTSVAVQGAMYDSYQHSSLGVELLVQQGVTVAVTNSAVVGAVGTFEAPSDAATDAISDEEVLSHSTQGYTQGDDVIIAKLGFADRLSGDAGNDTFAQVGTSDMVHGGSGDDTIRINSGDFASIDGGLGIDTLVMDGKSMHIDLSALGMKVQGFEKFDLGSGGNTLALSASDVLAGGVRDMVTADGKVQMLVNGANGDVDLLGGSDGWTQGGNTTVGDVTYSVYTNLAGTAELLVEDKVHVTIM